MNNSVQFPAIDTAALTKRAMLVSISIKMPSNSKQDKDASDELTAERHVKDGAARVNKTLFDKEVVKTFRGPASLARQDVVDLTLPWGQKGVRILLAENYFKLTERVKRHEDVFWAAVEKFKAQLENHINNSRVTLGTLFKEEDYPTSDEIEDAFSFELKFMPLTDGSDWRVNLGAEEEERMARRVQEQVENAVTAAAKEPWERLKEAVGALAERLEVRAKQEADPEGQKRLTPIKEALFDNLNDLTESISGLNILNDPNLERVAGQIRNLIRDTSAADLKGAPNMQKHIASESRKLEHLVDQYSGLM